jgi:hypothetical protein
MRYQLVLQWPASSIDDYDTIMEIEGALVETLTAGSELDGHDAGSGEINIFIRTDEPNRIFEEVKSVLGRREVWFDIRVAYRDLEATKYMVLWPKDLMDFTVT